MEQHPKVCILKKKPKKKSYTLLSYILLNFYSYVPIAMFLTSRFYPT